MNTSQHLNDTIVCDSARLQDFISSGNYDYNAELNNVEQPSVLGKAIEAFSNWLQEIIDNVFSGLDGTILSTEKIAYVWIALAVVLLLVVIYIMYKKRVFIFKKRIKDKENYEVVDDNIYGIDFEDDLAKALASGNYKEAVRLRYLQCLRMLADSNAIAWMAFKTPTQYTQEYKDDDFAELTRRYVLVRYGNYEASSAVFETITELFNRVEQRIKDGVTPMPLQEGGDT